MFFGPVPPGLDMEAAHKYLANLSLCTQILDLGLESLLLDLLFCSSFPFMTNLPEDIFLLHVQTNMCKN